ncbi:MAG: hypothetical protein HOV81_02085 [Kofleriaceae bacterium]|nr:hypothetical protein [Kofleriaceae bacterium]
MLVAMRACAAILVMSGLLSLASRVSADTVKQPTCSEPAAKPRAAKAIADVDWCNFDYGGGKGSRLTAGRSSLHLYRKLGEPHDTIARTLRGVIYGDLDGDKKREAAIILQHTTRFASRDTPSSSTTVYIYTLVDGAPRLLGSIPAADPVSEVSFAKGVVTVRSGTPTTAARYRRDRAGDFNEIAPAP